MKKGATRLQIEARQSISLSKWIKPISVSVTAISIMVAVSVLVLQLANKEIDQLTVNGDFKHITINDVERVLGNMFPAGFVSLDVNIVRAQLESMPLIAVANVEKSWSGELIITIEEEIPVAIWNGKKLLSQNGEVLPVAIPDVKLPRLVSSENDSRNVMEHFLLFKRWGKRHGLLLNELHNTASGWRLDHENGVTIWLDGSSAMKGLKQLESVIEQIQIERISRIDMRYEQGFAVAWRHSQAQVQG